jgi:hypothetical protein
MQCGVVGEWPRTYLSLLEVSLSHFRAILAPADGNLVPGRSRALPVLRQAPSSARAADRPAQL